MILLAYRHGLRASEVCDLRWDQVDFNQATLHVRRVKAGTPSTHPLTGAELRALRRLHREAKSPVVFVSERSSPFKVSGFRRMIERAASGLEIKVHPHMLRHACGFKLANDGGRCKRISGTRARKGSASSPSIHGSCQRWCIAQNADMTGRCQQTPFNRASGT